MRWCFQSLLAFLVVFEERVHTASSAVQDEAVGDLGGGNQATQQTCLLQVDRSRGPPYKKRRSKGSLVEIALKKRHPGRSEQKLMETSFEKHHPRPSEKISGRSDHKQRHPRHSEMTLVAEGNHPSPSEQHVVVVYNCFVYTKRPNWKEYIAEQLGDFVKSGLAIAANEINVVISMDKPNSSWYMHEDAVHVELAKAAVDIVREIIPRAVVELVAENQFEYPGINLMWNKANSLDKSKAPNTLFLYYHSKGMFNPENKTHPHLLRDQSWLRLQKHVIDPWKQILVKFAENPGLNKAGYAASPAGFIWFNWMWVRGSYLQNVIKPVLTSNRYYYEGWVSMTYPDNTPRLPHVNSVTYAHDNDAEPQPKNKPSGPLDCLSLCDADLTIGTYFQQQDIPWHNV